MARFLGFIKWVAVPIAVGCAGYFGVAPLLTPSFTNPAIPAPEVPQAASPAGPSVDVAVKSPKPERRRRRVKKKSKPSNAAPAPKPSIPVTPPEEPATTDAGGSGGAATAGGDAVPPDSETRVG